MGVRFWKPAERQAHEMPTWVAACVAEDVDKEDVIGFSHEDRDFAVYRTAESEFFATDGALYAREDATVRRARHGSSD